MTKKINQFLKFEPILKEKIWGGEKLSKILNKKSKQNNIGESWEISNVPASISVVNNSHLTGTNLNDLINTYTSSLLGDKVYKQFGTNFPLLIKFIDAKKALSIQVHPDNDVAKIKHNSFGKTEMWYIMNSDKDAELVVGFKEDSNKEEYLSHLKNKSLLDILNFDKVKKGDVYFVPAGRVHAIGAGVLLAEIQQTSDVTYRIYDWDRKDTQGNYRDLHTENALQVLDFSSKKNYKTTYNSTLKNNTETIVDCPYFTTNIVLVSDEVVVNHQTKDSFVVYMCVAGEVVFKYLNTEEKLLLGETLLVPASIKEFTIHSENESELLEVFIR